MQSSVTPSRPVVVFQPFAIWNYVQFLVNSSIVQVEKFADLSNVSVDGGVEIFKLACLVGKAHVVGINEFSVPDRYTCLSD